MPQRSIPPRVLDDSAFPLRVKLRVPPAGLGLQLIELLRWLRREVGEANFAHHDAETLGTEALAIHFRQGDDLHRFLRAFPHLELADETALPRYRKPATSRWIGERRGSDAVDET